MRKNTGPVLTLRPPPLRLIIGDWEKRDEKRAKEWGGSIYNSARKVAASKIARKRPALCCQQPPPTPPFSYFFFCCRLPPPLPTIEKLRRNTRTLNTYATKVLCRKEKKRRVERERERPPWIGKRRGASFCGSHNERHGTNTSPFTGNRWLLLQRVTRSMGEPIQPDLPIVWSKIEKHWDELAQRPVIQSRLNAR